MRSAVVRSAIDFSALVAEVARAGNGATSMFLGTVRSDNDGRDVTGIEYSAYDDMAVSEMASILGEAHDRFAVEQAAIEHRIGLLAIGDVSIAVVVATPHRDASMKALRYIVEETKARVPIWKLEHYMDGTREWVNSGLTQSR